MDERLRNILEWLYCMIAAIVLALIIRYYIGAPTIVKQVSMNPTLVENQKLWLSRWSRTKKEMPKRGDIITFEAPSKKKYNNVIDIDNPVAKYENEPKGFFSKFSYYVLEINKESYIKRVIALPGEFVEINNGKVYINNEELEEGYLQDDVVTNSRTFNKFIVPENCVFAMGDNRGHSTDCRDFGCIPLDKIESKVWIRIWPLNLWGRVE